ncbi:hypothetical protein AB0J38_07500 [Streptomyces sp. NPDC050095]|uniref:hypothetical protein n=1 Tax=unclassified Streptomyces TaxID=2593676 RepID=UPI00342EAABB
MAVPLAVLALGGVAVSATPAEASPSGGIVHGTSDPLDDWFDEAVSASAYSHSNVAALWQGILWADSDDG